MLGSSSVPSRAESSSVARLPAIQTADASSYTGKHLYHTLHMQLHVQSYTIVQYILYMYVTRYVTDSDLLRHDDVVSADLPTTESRKQDSTSSSCPQDSRLDFASDFAQPEAIEK